MKRHSRQSSLYPRQPLGLGAMGRQVVAFLLASSILMLNLDGSALAQVLDTTVRPVRGQISIAREVTIAPTKEKVSLSLRDANVKDVLQMLAKQGKFNLILDDSVGGTLTVDINNVSINKALEYIFTMMDLSYVKDANTVIVAKKATIEGRNMAVRSLKTIPVQYKSAINIANQLNNTIFRVPRSSGSGTALAAADPDSNSLLIMGTDADIKLVGDALRELDVPRNRKVYHIRHNLPNDVAQVLAANFFRNNPSVSINSGGGASSASASSASTSSSSGSTGGSSTGGSSGGSSGGSTGGSSTGGSSGGSTGGSSTGGSSGGSAGGSSTGGSSGGSTTGVSVSSFNSDGVTFISEPVSATLTILGTEEQIALIDSVIDQVDVQRAQVAIEVALVEIQNTDKKSFIPTLPVLRTGSGLIQLTGLNSGLNTFVLKNPFVNNNGVTFPTSVSGANQFTFRQSNLNTRNKVLANPTMVTIDGQAVTINISDSVASVTYSATLVNGATQITPTITQQQAGVSVSLTPKVYNDGSVVINGLTPTVTQPSGVLTIPGSGSVPASSIALLSTRTMSVAGVRVRDGETLVIGGLLKESNQININKVPGLDRLPVLGAMFRAINQNDKDKTELVLMVTPHILKDDSVAYFNNTNSGKYSNMNYGRGGIIPVSLPKFMGPVEPSSEPMPSASPNSALPPTSSNHASKKKGASLKTAELPQVPAALAVPQTTAQTPSSIKSPAVATLQAPPASQLQVTPGGLLDIGSLLKSARIDMMPPGPALEKSEGVAALKLSPVASKKSVGNTGGVTNVYQHPASKLNRLNIMDEILK